MTASALKPCPMCGGTDLRVMGDAPLQAILGGYHVFCDSPSCQCEGRHSGDREKAIRAWNRRAPASPDWRPIAEAPQDGSRLMLWDSVSRRPVFGSWRGDNPAITHYAAEPAGPVANDGPVVVRVSMEAAEEFSRQRIARMFEVGK
ncbi:Lar family restriction alleviation protein [Stenotrophomonas maltophilia]|nr:Lar family restriction alleviation protein [Stenotrophomonas maltophilia]